ncbi:hypothetical protein Glo7428_2073 [Gloeocapsa sp. PCC 7428]|uniref:hypothetical protein n=1 Tax=Gloeocapsa sp. PCC 7428 TaxID=1173026 RepID=UPI0002A5CA72|nr:hypothetical protein [Gloeocapsa sp. PCC 7428]AFZ30615.1 hypothetical protein Glo7428_2073 [Gloeocapsa sp. PCC 7428]
MFTKFYPSATLFLAISFLMPTATLAAPVVRKAAGPNAATIQSAVDDFRNALGQNNGVGGTFPNGRREINWDGVPDNFAASNKLPPDFFNVDSPRGVFFQTPGQGFQVSANIGVAPIEFGNLNPTYSSIFRVFSPQRLFTALGSNITNVLFFVPGTAKKATVNGFGAIFTDVDRWGSTKIEYFGANNKLLFSDFVPNVPNSKESLSFLGVVFNQGERIYRVRITSGNTALSYNNNDGGTKDIVVMDDFIYGEPQPQR